MKRFIQGEHRGQSTLLPESLEDYVSDTTTLSYPIYVKEEKWRQKCYQRTHQYFFHRNVSSLADADTKMCTIPF